VLLGLLVLPFWDEEALFCASAVSGRANATAATIVWVRMFFFIPNHFARRR
jgi:hypothetical protein